MPLEGRAPRKGWSLVALRDRTYGYLFVLVAPKHFAFWTCEITLISVCEPMTD